MPCYTCAVPPTTLTMTEKSSTIPPELFIEAQISPEEARMALARALFHDGRMSREEARDFSGDPAGFEAALFREAERLDLNDFLDWASHDLKSPLNSIIGFSRVVLKGIDGPINESQQADISTVYSNGQHLFNLLSMLVDIARLNKGSLELSLTEVNLANIVDEVTTRWKSQNASRELATTIKLEQPVIKLDAQKMKQVISGSLSYAALRVKPGGTVGMEANQEDGRIHISINSKGERDPAMPELERVMIPFINRALVKLHRGELQESENPEGGVRLDLWFPG